MMKALNMPEMTMSEAMYEFVDAAIVFSSILKVMHPEQEYEVSRTFGQIYQSLEPFGFDMHIAKPASA